MSKRLASDDPLDRMDARTLAGVAVAITLACMAVLGAVTEIETESHERTYMDAMEEVLDDAGIGPSDEQRAAAIKAMADALNEEIRRARGAGLDVEVYVHEVGGIRAEILSAMEGSAPPPERRPHQPPPPVRTVHREGEGRGFSRGATVVLLILVLAPFLILWLVPYAVYLGWIDR